MSLPSKKSSSSGSTKEVHEIKKKARMKERSPEAKCGTCGGAVENTDLETLWTCDGCDESGK
eukprot:CAMPEP_0197898752 /NCGR_PEP_ID=MMETSP1439-20131203/44771_1 /TAXON_ID=66791 /ORGANISM="Gonyaulax spinifera, Strain CCMP409" /LENGTH=61 /DNA_ID=CAMNT_0043519497 /DNA_START=52 /DNA_END=234 /DNA_ORIENTATION=+